VAGSARTAAAGAGPNQKYYSPLNSNKGHGSVVAALSELRTSLHYGSDNGGDTHSVAASDQHAPRDKGAAAPSQVSSSSCVRPIVDCNNDCGQPLGCCLLRDNSL
jgi:hypothetical protein